MTDLIRANTDDDWIATVEIARWDGTGTRRIKRGASPHLTEQQARASIINAFRRSITTVPNQYGLPIGWHLPPGGVKVISLARRKSLGIKSTGTYEEMLARLTRKVTA